MLTHLQFARLILLRTLFSATSMFPQVVGAGTMVSQAIEIRASHRTVTPVCVLGETTRHEIATIAPSCHAR